MDSSSSKVGPPRPTYPQIFCGIDMYIDPTGIPERPALVRRLKAYGASPPCHNPRDAEIIIVSTNSASGRRFIRDWGNDPSKVVLGVAWVQDCIKQGKPLLLADGWGGHVAEDDGLPIPDGDTDLDQTAEETVHLPTPRQTPKESTPKTLASLSTPDMPGKPKPKPWPNIEKPKANQEAPPNAKEAAIPSAETSPAPSAPSDQNLIQGNQAQQYPPLPPHSPAVFTGPPGTYPPQMYMQQPVNAIGGYPILPYNIPIQPEQFASNMVPQVNFPQTQQYRSSYGYQVPNGMVSGLYNLNGAYPPHPISSNVTNQNMNAMDVDSISPPPSSTIRLDSEPGSSGKPNSFAEAYSSLQSQSRKRKNSSRSHRQPSGSRRRTSTPELISESEGDGSSVTELPIPPSQRPQPSSSTQKAGGKIFVRDDGNPMQFFVMVTMHGRRGDLIQKIKRCGGMVTSDISMADYAILRNDGKAEFKTHFSQCQNAGTNAVSPRFIDDCIDEERILDADDYGFKDADASPRRHRQSRQSSQTVQDSALKRRRKRVDDSPRPRKGSQFNADIPAPSPSPSPEPQRETKLHSKRKGKQKKASTTEAENVVETKPKIKSEEEPSLLVARNHKPSPPPPPFHTRKEFSAGKWCYTSDDIQCANDYVQILLERDPQISNTKLSRKLHEKMPYHSANSWSNQLASKVNVDLLREKIERRMRLYGTSLGKESAAPEQESPASVQSTSPTKAKRGNQERLAAEDFEFILDFFMNGGAEDPDDIKVWANLSAKRPCQTAEDWPTFYERNKDAVDSSLKAYFTTQNQ